PLWTAPAGAGGGASVANGVVYIDSGRAFDAAGATGCSGTPTTCAPLTTVGAGTGETIIANGWVYRGLTSTGLQAFHLPDTQLGRGNLGSLAVRWTAPFRGNTALGTNPDMLYLSGEPSAGGTRHLRAFDPAGVTGCSGTPRTCAPLWESSIVTDFDSVPVVAG